MKKLMFTAITMVAFSSASMANTIADENVVVNEKDEVIVKRRDECAQGYFNTYTANVEQYGETVAESMALAAWRACRDALYGDGN